MSHLNKVVGASWDGWIVFPMYQMSDALGAWARSPVPTTATATATTPGGLAWRRKDSGQSGPARVELERIWGNIAYIACDAERKWRQHVAHNSILRGARGLDIPTFDIPRAWQCENILVRRLFPKVRGCHSLLRRSFQRLFVFPQAYGQVWAGVCAKIGLFLARLLPVRLLLVPCLSPRRRS